jgi:hypothetical protein
MEINMPVNISLDGAQAIFSFAFKDPRWKMKFLIGTLLGFAGYIVPILPGLIVLGYGATIMRQIIVDNAGASLPEWDDWGKLLSRGFKMGSAMFIFMLPVIILFVGGYFLMMFSFFGSVFSQSNSAADTSAPTVMFLLGSFGGMTMFVVAMLISLPLGLLLPAAVANGVAKDSFLAAFHLREWWKILRVNAGGFFTALVLVYGSYVLLIFALQIVYMTVILCFLLPLLANILSFYLTIVCAAALGEAYRRGAELTQPAATADEPVFSI